ncbi:DUF3349 domain-containing protein [Dermacoccaceae bacterium W4C1]
MLDWLNAGYPSGIPPKDYNPVLALLRRRLTDDEVAQVTAALAAHEDPTRVDIGVGISKVTDELPSEEDIRRVQEHLDLTPGGPPDEGRG